MQKPLFTTDKYKSSEKIKATDLQNRLTAADKQFAYYVSTIEAKMVKRAEIDDMLNRLANMENSI